MIESELRKAVAALAKRGMSAREISLRLKISRNTVAAIIAQDGRVQRAERKDKIPLDPELLARLYAECGGYVQRVHEKLLEEERIEVEYSTLTRRLRELEISTPPSRRCARVSDEPGAEMQHDTSSYKVVLGETRTSVIASVLYLRYSKRRYVKFYRRFNRFRMKCFFHEALVYWGHAAPVCIIDNTNLARLSGAGKHARMAPEMEEFSRRYGFRFQCHEIGHANRKAGEERSFRTVQTNFLQGRSFEGLEDLNRQAHQWATERMEGRSQTRAKIVPAQAFAKEKAYLVKVPADLPAPYRPYTRTVDQYGYVAFERNYYWVPGEGRGEAKVLEYADRLEIYRGRELLCSYPLHAEGVRNQRVSPEGMPRPRHGPRNCKRPTAEEEARLRALAPSVGAYLDKTLAPRGILTVGTGSVRLRHSATPVREAPVRALTADERRALHPQRRARAPLRRRRPRGARAHRAPADDHGRGARAAGGVRRSVSRPRGVPRGRTRRPAGPFGIRQRTLGGHRWTRQ